MPRASELKVKMNVPRRVCFNDYFYRYYMTISSKHRCLSVGILFADVGCVPVSHFPSPGELVPTEGVDLLLGGCASNVALNLARLNVTTGLCGCVGQDAFGDFVTHALEHPLIDQNIRQVPGKSTGSTMVINVQGQDRRFISTTGANFDFGIKDIPQAWFDESEILYIGGFLMMPLLESDEMKDFLKAYQARGGKTILDVVLFGSRPYWDAVKPLLPYVNYFTPNNDEGKAISGQDDPLDQAKFFVDAGAEVSIITCGEKGVIYYSEKEKFRSDVFPVDFVGGTGSGDAFIGGFIAGLLDGELPEQVIQRASAQGMSCVRDTSATKSVFTRKESDEFLATHKLNITSLS